MAAAFAVENLLVYDKVGKDLVVPTLISPRIEGDGTGAEGERAKPLLITYHGTPARLDIDIKVCMHERMNVCTNACTISVIVMETSCRVTAHCSVPHQLTNACVCMCIASHPPIFHQASPLTICANMECVGKVAQCFQFDMQSEGSAAYIQARLMRMLAPYMAMAMADIYLALDVAAPKIIVPENSSSNGGKNGRFKK